MVIRGHNVEEANRLGCDGALRDAWILEGMDEGGHEHGACDVDVERSQQSAHVTFWRIVYGPSLSTSFHSVVVVVVRQVVTIFPYRSSEKVRCDLCRSVVASSYS